MQQSADTTKTAAWHATDRVACGPVSPLLVQVRLLLLAAMCREHILLIGPPGE